MALYEYRCDDGHTLDLERPIGTAQRMTKCQCGKTAKLVIGAAVNIAPSALETRGARVREIESTEGRWSTDMAAYKRMRNKGMQPNQIDGSAALEDRAGDQLDIQWQNLYKEGIKREEIIERSDHALQIMEQAKEAG